MPEPLLCVRDLHMSYDHGRVLALRGVSLSAKAGESVAVMGPSGCGKSTLLSLIGLLDVPDSGRIVVDGQVLAEVRDASAYRARCVGVVFQDHHLIPAMTVQENVEAPMLSLGLPRRERHDRARQLLGQLDLLPRAAALPGEISGGERQRAAVGRALANRPQLLLADEPTGNLDAENGGRVVELFLALAREQGLAILMATHNPEIAARCDRLVRMRDGRIDGHA